MGYAIKQPTAAEYRAAFAREAARSYPRISLLEAAAGYALDRERLEDAAAVLACPLKVNPPNWQHGRVIYARVRRYLEALGPAAVGAPVLLDIGTAKGFSALCLRWAADDAGFAAARVHSVDVLEPLAAVRRNTIAEVDGWQPLEAILEPWPEARRIRFECSTGIDWLLRHGGPAGCRVYAAFVDGKHDRASVTREIELLASSQRAGDLVIFDDVQIHGVAEAIGDAAPRWYRVEVVPLGEDTGRIYAIGQRV